MNIEELKAKWGGSLPQVGDWISALELHGTSHVQLEMPETQDELVFTLLGAYDSTSPIPLTREVLEKIKEAGPVYIPEPTFGDECIECRFSKPQIGGLLFTVGIYPSGESYLIMGNRAVRNPYLHNVQQLYRLLIGGKELTYTP